MLISVIYKMETTGKTRTRQPLEKFEQFKKKPGTSMQALNDVSPHFALFMVTSQNHPPQIAYSFLAKALI